VAGLSEHIADNLRSLRKARQLSQQGLADLADVPRATLAHLESGSANPTLSLLLKVAEALQVSLDCLTDVPAPAIRHRKVQKLKTRRRASTLVRHLLLDEHPGWSFDRVTLAQGGRWSWSPRATGGSLHLVCETGALKLEFGGESCHLASGDVAQVAGAGRLQASNTARREAVFYLLSLPLTPTKQ
jgi:transcriptional regulator with XRE-family HTH domain